MSFISFVVVPPAFIMLRKMIRRIYGIARNQFTGGTRILETMQETVQGIRIVKAFTLENVMRAQLEADVAALEAESNKWARIAHRASPLMEALGGFAIAGAMIYGGFRVLETGATPGQFFSFLAAFMLAYEPAKRLARLNIDLNTGLGRCSHPVRHHRHAVDRTARRRPAAALAHDRPRGVFRCSLRLSAGRAGHIAA